MKPRQARSAEPVCIREACTDAHETAPSRAPVGVRVGVRTSGIRIPTGGKFWLGRELYYLAKMSPAVVTCITALI